MDHVMTGILDADETQVEARAQSARAHAAKMREASRLRAAEAKARVGATKLANALAIDGRVLHDEVLAPGPWTRKLAAGRHLRIIDLEGQQAVDFLCYDQANFENRYNAANTIKLNGKIYIGAGVRLISEFADTLMTVVEDKVGYHDTIAGCCSAESNFRRYGIKGTANCRSNFIQGLAAHGMSANDIAANINFFMHVPVRADGSTEIVEGLSEPGDYVDLRADKDVLVVISNCPQLYNPCNGWDPTPVRLIEWRPS
jgi:uncharacterized protein